MYKHIVLFAFLLLSFLHANASEHIAKVTESYEINNTEIFRVKSNILGRYYDIYIKVPFDYYNKESEKKTYPALYLNDGPYTFKVASGVTHFREMDKAIVVGISFAKGENGQFSRVRDLTPEMDKSWTKYKTGGAVDYLRFLENEVIAFVEKNYRANSKRRILSGHSLGGSFGAWVMLTQPELFSSYILTSPSLWFKKSHLF